MEENKEKTGYKHTLNLPHTDFSMKANLQQREPETLKVWDQAEIYRKILDSRKDPAKTFILHDGPPYANGNIHMGHVLNKILKDICVKYFAMKGYRAPYVPGWDCHGLPVEHQLFKELGMTKHDIGQLEFRKKAYKYAMRYVKIQVEEFKRLGIFGDWNDPYLTLSKNYEADIIGSLADLCEKGYIYKDLKPVNWCSKCETALAEAEVEYEDKVSPSVYVKFKTSSADGKKETFFVIWTTTPWTLLANVAVALHPDFVYSFVDTGHEILIMASDLVESIMKRLAFKEYSILQSKKGSVIETEFLKARHPFIDRDSKIVTAGYVTKEDGTGCVHTAPGHGQEDHITGKRYALPVIMPVKSNGKFSDEAGEFAGLDVIEANKAIMDKMKKFGVLMASGEVKHSYPHCWRCKEPIIFRATKQWFMSVDHMGLRAKMDKAIKEDVEWIPRAGCERIGSMLRTRPDWCLSRQRYWGVPIPALECVACGEAFTDASIIRNIAKLARDRGADVWFELPVEKIVPEGKKCAKCGKTEFKKENDILDVWFDSGVSHRAVVEARKELSFPADLYLEGSDQHRGWFQAALITSMAMNGRPPYKKVLTHGFVVDGEGKKMSKSVGNVISPEEIMKKYGADILRLWVSSSDYEGDIKISPEILERLADGYRKIRNTFRYLLSNLYDFEPSKDALSVEDLSETDRWMLSRLAALSEEVDGYYAAWEFHKVYRAVYNFCVYEISAFYLDVIKDVLYVMAPSSRERRSAQTVVFRLLHVLVRMMAPVLSFTSEEVWSAVSFKGKEGSVHLAAWPTTGDEEISSWKKPELDRKFADILKIRDGVMKILEVKREKALIGSSLEAAIELYSEDTFFAELIKEKIELLPSLFKVSQVCFTAAVSGEHEDIVGLPIKARVSRADGEKCQRCWNFTVTVGKNKNAPDLCERCYNVVSRKENV